MHVLSGRPTEAAADIAMDDWRPLVLHPGGASHPSSRARAPRLVQKLQIRLARLQGNNSTASQTSLPSIPHLSIDIRTSSVRKKLRL